MSAGPWLTIVSVHKEATGDLAKTLDSIAMQDGRDVEVVVVDSSSDQLAAEARGVASVLQDCRYVWMAPRGIYAAMNLGISVARGRFTMFVNSGDSLADTAVLAAMRELASEHVADWYYGQVEFELPNGLWRPPAKWSYEVERAHHFRRGRFPMQPAMIVKTATLRELGGFDTRYEVAADYHLMLRLSERSRPYPSDTVVSSFAVGGTSSVRWRQALREGYEARCEVFELAGLATYAELVKSLPEAGRTAASRLRGRR